MADHRVRGAVGHMGRLAKWFAALLIGTVIGVVGSTYGPGVLHSLFGETPNFSEQIDSINHQASKEDYGIRWQQRLTGLHGSAQESIVMVLSDRRDVLNTPTHETRPDEIRIYDLRGSHGHETLVLRFRFRPLATAEAGSKTQWRYELRAIRDIDGDGERDVLGAFHENRADYGTYRPVMIYWDDRDEKYSMVALISVRPHLKRYREPGHRGPAFRAEYEQTERLVDDRSAEAITPYAASQYAVAGGPAGITTTAAYFLSDGGPELPVIQLSQFRVDLFTPNPKPECEFPYVWFPKTLSPLTEQSLAKEANAVATGGQAPFGC